LLATTYPLRKCNVHYYFLTKKSRGGGGGGGEGDLIQGNLEV